MAAAPGLSDFYHLIELDTVGSTSDEVARLARAGAASGTLVVAHSQTNGHGRLGRSWISPAGNLYFSLLLRPACRVGEAVQLTFVAAVALADALSAVLPADRTIACKWPNDVLVGGRKIAGILLESEADGHGRVESLVIGIGVNVSSHPAPEAVMYAATSIHAEGAADETAHSTLGLFCHAFQRRYDEWQSLGFEAVRAAWLSRADKLHQRIEVGLDAGTVAGTFVGLDGSGAMVLEEGAKRRLILAGDVLPSAA